MKATLVAEIAESGNIVPPLATGGAVPRFRLARKRLQQLDSSLSVVESRTVALPVETRLLAAQPGLVSFAADAGNLLVESSNGRTLLPIRGADAAAYLPATPDRLVVVAPCEDKGSTIHQLFLIDLSEREARIIAHHTVNDAYDATATVISHPVDNAVMVDLAMGQDGSILLRVDVAADALNVTDVLTGQDPVCAGFSPDGARLLLTPHPNDPEIASVLEWPGLARAGDLSGSAVGAKIGLGISGCYLGNTRVLLISIEAGLILAGRDLENAVPLDAPALTCVAGGSEIEWVCALDSTRFAVGVWEAESGRRALIMELQEHAE